VLLPQLRRIRWAVRATLLLGVAASVLANILHALDNPISQAIAAWPPVALLLTVELISRVPVHRRLLAATRLIATAVISGIAAWVSYWHMAGVAAHYGETGASPYLLPLSVDGLIVVASICLVELSGRMASLEQPAGQASSHIMVDALPDDPATLAQAESSVQRAMPTASAAPPVELAPPLRRSTAAALAEVAATLPRSTPFTPTVTRGGGQHLGRSPVDGRANSGNHSAPTQRRAGSSSAHSGKSTQAGRARRSPAETVALAARIKAERPALTEAELAAELGISLSRWRTVRREAAPRNTDRQLAA
jgi:hypothetical protein